MATQVQRLLTRTETWWWTGPLGHLVAGVADWAQALGGWWLYRARRNARARLARRTG